VANVELLFIRELLLRAQKFRFNYLCRMSAKWRPQHIHDCKEHTLIEKYGTASYYSRYTTWLKPLEIEGHYQDHLENLDLFYGLQKRKNTLIIGGLSPWDLGNEIYVQFTDRPTFKSHLSSQLYGYYAAGQKNLPCLIQGAMRRINTRKTNKYIVSMMCMGFKISVIPYTMTFH
jgi:hypothetical protein